MVLADPLPMVKVVPFSVILPPVVVSPVPVVNVLLPVWITVPLRVITPDPLFGLNVISPVVLPPRVSGWLLVVWICDPPLVKVSVPVVVELPVLPKIWNLAEEVDVPPMAKSSAILNGDKTPRFLCQKPETLPEEIILLTYKLFHCRSEERR